MPVQFGSMILIPTSNQKLYSPNLSGTDLVQKDKKLPPLSFDIPDNELARELFAYKPGGMDRPMIKGRATYMPIVDGVLGYLDELDPLLIKVLRQLGVEVPETGHTSAKKALSDFYQAKDANLAERVVLSRTQNPSPSERAENLIQQVKDRNKMKIIKAKAINLIK